MHTITCGCLSYIRLKKYLNTEAWIQVTELRCLS